MYSMTGGALVKKKSDGDKLTIYTLPKEVRGKIFSFLNEVPEGHFRDPAAELLPKTLESLLKVDPLLCDEAKWAISRNRYIPQTIRLSSKTFDQNYALGSPQKSIVIKDWYLLQSIVIKIPYADWSARNFDTDDPSDIVLKIPANVSSPLTIIQNISEVVDLPELKQIRYDLEYVPHIAKLKKVVQWSMTELISIGPHVLNVWAEATGLLTDNRPQEIVRAYNGSRRMNQTGELSEEVFRFEVCYASKGGIMEREVCRKNVTAEDLEFVEQRFARVLETVEVRDGYAVRMCPGCFVCFHGEEPLDIAPETSFVVEKDIKAHHQRALANHGKEAAFCDRDKFYR